jgi:hypothetical protein
MFLPEGGGVGETKNNTKYDNVYNTNKKRLYY